MARSAGAKVPRAAGQNRDLELAYMSVGEQLRLFKQKTLSPVEVQQAQLHLTEQRGKLMNCFTYLHPKEAMAQAKSRSGAGSRAIHGLSNASRWPSRMRWP